MSWWDRNERLYQHLLGMGLVCTPIMSVEDPEKIEALYVTTVLPATTEQRAQNSTHGAVGFPMKSPEIRDVVTAPEGDGINVVDFPSTSRATVTVL